MSTLDSTSIRREQEVCRKYGARWFEAPLHRKVGIAPNVRSGLLPINGLRHPPEGDTTGGYIWAGEELKTDPDFFVPLDVEHLGDWCPVILPYLGLPPGWRFLVAGSSEDVWFDPTLLEV
jgi:hypothetical protein